MNSLLFYTWQLLAVDAAEIAESALVVVGVVADGLVVVAGELVVARVHARHALEFGAHLGVELLDGSLARGQVLLLLEVYHGHGRAAQYARLRLALHLLAQLVQEGERQRGVRILAHDHEADLDERELIDAVLEVADELLVHVDENVALLQLAPLHHLVHLERELVPQSGVNNNINI